MSAFLATHSRENKWNELFLFVQDVLKENEELKEQNRSLWRMLHLEPEMKRRENNKPLPRRRVSRSEDEVTFLFEKRSQLGGEERVRKFSVNANSSGKSWDILDNCSELTPEEISRRNGSVVSELTIPRRRRRGNAEVTRAALEMAPLPPPCSQYGKRRWKDSEEMKFVKEVNEIIEKKISVGEMQEQREVAQYDNIEEKNDENIKHIVFLDEEKLTEIKPRIVKDDDVQCVQDLRNDIRENPREIKKEDCQQMEECEEQDEECEEQDEECEEQVEDEECEEEEQVEKDDEDEECEEEEQDCEEQVEEEKCEEEEECEEEKDEECEEQEDEEEEQEEEDEVEEIIYKGKKYYKDIRNTIYSIDTDEEVGPEIGKYNPQTQSIEFHDSNK